MAGNGLNRFEKSYQKVMAEKKEHMRDDVAFLFSAVQFIVDTGKLAEFSKWQADKAEFRRDGK